MPNQKTDIWGRVHCSIALFVMVNPDVEMVAAYFRRATRHLSASWIPLLPLFAVVYAARSFLPSDWSINAALIIMLGLTLRALWPRATSLCSLPRMVMS